MSHDDNNKNAQHTTTANDLIRSIRRREEKENVANKAIEECGDSRGKNQKKKTYGCRARDKLASTPFLVSCEKLNKKVHLFNESSEEYIYWLT